MNFGAQADLSSGGGANTDTKKKTILMYFE